MADPESLARLLEAFKNGDLDTAAAAEAIRAEFFQDLGHTVVDHDRAQRTGAGEVVFGAGKSSEQISDIVRALQAKGANVLVTRLDADKYARLPAFEGDSQYHADSGILTCIQQTVEAPATHVGVVSAGTSDMRVAEEAALTAEFYGNRVQRIYDVGVAGLHRLLARVDDIRSARVLVVVAGMEGALPSVVGGLVDKPVIAVPTSIGYGAAFDGVAALLGMLTSCASGISVVNIDNGFGAGYLANTINRL